ncbi:MAG: hypothetical protein HXY40_04280 [Chloroflexi bacterium]|nr:hypothetical protein [Chloroflexota bacterium]
MPVTVQWDDDAHTIIYFRLTAPWSWDDYEHGDQQVRALLDSVNHTVDIILDFASMGMLPLNSFPYIRRAAIDIHPNQGMVAILGINAFLRMLGNAMEAVYPQIATTRRPAASKEEAYRMIAQARAARVNPRHSAWPPGG